MTMFLVAALVLVTDQVPEGPVQSPAQSYGVEVLKANAGNIRKYAEVAVGWHVMQRCNSLEAAARSEFEQDVAKATRGVARVFGSAYGDRMMGLQRTIAIQQKAQMFATANFMTCDSRAAELVTKQREEAQSLAAALAD
uniref:hypothetical protein n=1 Tax=uncultured Sphingomonas sp. TaxID=158754 RepID=UPI0025D4E117|nr:hypothetical protein [uncultured Sphingomonas sp.]